MSCRSTALVTHHRTVKTRRWVFSSSDIRRLWVVMWLDIAVTAVYRDSVRAATVTVSTVNVDTGLTQDAKCLAELPLSTTTTLACLHRCEVQQTKHRTSFSTER